MAILLLFTAFMGYQARDIKMAYNFNTAVPVTDPLYKEFQDFKSKFGEDGNILVLGVKDSSLYQIENFNAFRKLSEDLGTIEGTTNVLSIGNLQNIVKDTENRSFKLEPLLTEPVENQKELDKVLSKINDLKFFQGQLLNVENGATLILVNMDRDVLNSSKRNPLVDEIKKFGDAFQTETGIEMHYSGMPYVRTQMQYKTSKELTLFIKLSIAVTALILFLFFRSLTAVFFPLIVIAVVVTWVVGTVGLLNYEINALTGLIPSIIIVIGIPNSIYLLNKYHQGFAKHGNKARALSQMIRKIGLVTFITNFTTAVGFLVLATTDITLLKQFGLVAGINVLATIAG